MSLAPNTRQALERIVYCAKNNMLGATWASGCVYRSGHGADTRYCVIGCLFDDEALDVLHDRDLMRAVVSKLYDKVPGLEETLGLSLDQSNTLQMYHDSVALHGYRSWDLFAEDIQRILDNDGGYLWVLDQGVEF